MTMVVMTTAGVAEKRPADDDDDAAECPAHILSFLKHHLGGESPIHIHAEKSAQQSVLILRYAQPDDDEKQALEQNQLQQQQLSLSSTSLPSRPPETDDCCTTKDENNTIMWWRDRLIQGNYRLVVRIWKGGSRWWNLHRNNDKKTTPTTSATDQQNGCNNNQQVNGNNHYHHHHHMAVQELATSEIAGYTIARIAAANIMNHHQPSHQQHQESSNGTAGAVSSSPLVIPLVLHADTDCYNDHHDPWAIFEYVGRNNPRFFSSFSSSSKNSNNNHNDNDSNNNMYDDYWTRHMILVRDEFGFSEPHPRWGRVPVDKCLDYATTVLVEVIIPLHESFLRLQQKEEAITSSCSTNNSNRSNHNNNGIFQKRNEEFQQALQKLSGWKCDQNYDDDDESHERSGYTYETMIGLYKSAWKEMSSSMDNNNIDSTNNDNNNYNNIEDRRLRQAIQLLGQCIDHLQTESETIIIKPLPPVLVHMDCQPQNLLFARRRAGGDDAQQQSSSSSLHVSSLLDWEEAAYADPRFELLLLGRKVCANKSQAQQIWNLYETHQRSNHINNNASFQLGPIDPWLCLETVHSLTTLLLQAMDLAGGGRSPWESKPDLWGKIEREFGRLVASGCTFCQEYAAAAVETM